MIHGQFKIWLPGDKDPLVLPNSVVDQGEIAFLKMIARDDQTVVAAGANFYIGLMGAVFLETSTLATIAGEPTVTFGYARKAVLRNAAGWPTQDVVAGIQRIASAIVTFTAAGGNFSVAISRAFLCSVAAGAAGTLFAVSGAAPAPILITDGTAFQVQYELFLR